MFAFANRRGDAPGLELFLPARLSIYRTLLRDSRLLWALAGQIPNRPGMRLSQDYSRLSLGRMWLSGRRPWLEIIKRSQFVVNNNDW